MIHVSFPYRTIIVQKSKGDYLYKREMRNRTTWLPFSQQKKKTIERLFADAKEKHAMRHTQCKGSAQVTNRVKLKLDAMNFKKSATWKWTVHFHLLIFPFFSPQYAKAPACRRMRIRVSG